MQSGTESQPGTGELADDTRVANADDKQRMPLHADEAGGNGGEVGTELGSEGQDPEVSMATSDTAEDSEAEGGQAGDGEADDIADEPPDTLAMAELRQLTASFPLEKRDIERVVRAPAPEAQEHPRAAANVARLFRRGLIPVRACAVDGAHPCLRCGGVDEARPRRTPAASSAQKSG